MAFRVLPRKPGEKAICDAIERKDWKQAQRLVDAKLKKKHDPYLLALEAYILASDPSHAFEQDVIERLNVLADTQDAGGIDDLETLELYDECVKVFHCAPSVERMAIPPLCHIRLSSFKSNSHNKALGEDAFRVTLRHKAYYHAHSISTTLKQKFPSERKYLFWNLCAAWLCYDQPCNIMPRGTNMTREQLGKMAKLLLINLVKKTKSGLEDRPADSILEPQELLLAHNILGVGEMQLLSDNVGPESPAARNGWVFKRYRMQELRHHGQHLELFNYCCGLIEASLPGKDDVIQSAEGADMLVWDLLLETSLALGTVESDDKTYELIKRATSDETRRCLDKTYARNALLAAVEYFFVADKSQRRSAHLFDVVIDERVGLKLEDEVKSASDIEVTSRVLVLAHYFRRQSSAPSAFSDLKKYILRLSVAEQKAFLRVCGQTSFEHAAYHHKDHQVEMCVSDTIEKFKGMEVHENTHGNAASLITASVTLEKIEYLCRTNHRDVFVLTSGSSPDRETNDATWPHEMNSLDDDKSSDDNSSDTIKGEGYCFWCHCANDHCLCLDSLAANSLRLYDRDIKYDESTGSYVANSLEVTDLYPGDDRLLLATMCLVKIFLRSQEENEALTTAMKAKPLLQAVAVLELGAEHSQANAHFNLLLVRLYSKLGAASLALRAYRRLNIKGVQHDTLSYAFFDRISLLHPLPIDDETLGLRVDIIKELDNIKTTYEKAERQIADNIWLSFQLGNYDTANQLIKVQERFAESMGRGFVEADRSRIMRLANVSGKPRPRCAFVYIKKTAANLRIDNTDHRAFPNFEADTSRTFERATQDIGCRAPPPSLQRLSFSYHTETISEIFSLDVDDHFVDDIMPRFHDLCRGYDKAIEVIDCSSLSDFEVDMARGAHAIITCVKQNWQRQDTEKDSTNILTTMLEPVVHRIKTRMNIIQQNIRDVETNFIPSSDYLAALYIYLDLSVLAKRAGDCLKSVADSIEGRTAMKTRGNIDSQKLLHYAKEIRELVRKTAKAVKQAANASNRIDVFRDAIVGDENDPIGKYLVSIAGHDYLEGLAELMVGSWKEATLPLGAF